MKEKGLAAMSAFALGFFGSVAHLFGEVPPLASPAPASSVAAPVPPAEPAGAAGTAAPGTAVRHTVVVGDTMWDLAMRYYKDHYKWNVISQANPPPSVHDPHWIYPGQVLIIPPLQPEAAPMPEKAPEPEAEPEVEPEPEAAPAAEKEAAALEAPEEEAPAPPPPAPRPEFKPEQAAGMTAVPEGLSERLPKGLVSMPPSTHRFMAQPGWQADGKIVTLEEQDIVAAEGDFISVHLIDAASAQQGRRYLVFRKAAPTDVDKDQNATYLSKVGLIEIRRPLGGKTFRALVVRANDPIQSGDLIQRER